MQIWMPNAILQRWKYLSVMQMPPMEMQVRISMIHDANTSIEMQISFYDANVFFTRYKCKFWFHVANDLFKDSYVDLLL